MRTTTLPGMIHALKAMAINPVEMPDNVRILVELDRNEFEKLLDEVYHGRGGIIKRTSRIKGYIEGELTGIKFKIERK